MFTIKLPASESQLEKGAGENRDPRAEASAGRTQSVPRCTHSGSASLGVRPPQGQSPAPWAPGHCSQDTGQGFGCGPLFPPGTGALTASCLLGHRPAGSQVASALFLCSALLADQCRGHPSLALGLKGRPAAPLPPNPFSLRTAWHSEPLHLPF